MIPYSQRLVQHARAPRDLAEVSSRLSANYITPSEAADALNTRHDSWQGIQGQFRGSLVRVERAYSPDGEALEATVDGELTKLVGHLGALEVVTIKLRRKYDDESMGRAVLGATLTIPELDVPGQEHLDPTQAYYTPLAVDVRGALETPRAVFKRVQL